MTSGYIALREGCAWLDLAGRGLIRAAGEDRVRLLHALTTNHIEQLAPGQGCYAFFLNAQGRILADVSVLCAEDALLLDTEPETRERVLAHLDRYIIADDVTLEELPMSALGVEGPKSEEVLRAAGAPIPDAAYAHLGWASRLVARLSSTGAEGFRLFLPAAEREAAVRMLEAAGAVAAGAEAARAVRIEQGRPRYGEDFSDRHLPHETHLLHALHFNKGCYLGQEIVERVRSRGMVHRFLTRLEIDSDTAPEPGEKITSEGKEVGEITSAVFSPAAGKVVALGYVRRSEVKGEIEIAGRVGRLLSRAGL